MCMQQRRGKTTAHKDPLPSSDHRIRQLCKQHLLGVMQGHRLSPYNAAHAPSPLQLWPPAAVLLLGRT